MIKMKNFPLKKNVYQFLCTLPHCILGGFGVDFSSDPDKLEEGLKIVAKGLLQHGVTSYCPTIVTSSQESYKEVCHV